MKILLALFLLSFSPLAQANSVGFIEIVGTINPGSADYIRTSISLSAQNKDEALIIKLNTPGGLLSSTRDIIQFISESTIPVVVYVAPGGASATSAGAIIGIASHVVAMAPGTNIGAAHPVSSGGKDVEGEMAKKVTNDTSALVRSQAHLRKRNVGLADEIVTKSISLTAEDAAQKRVVDFVAKDFDDVLKQLNGKKVALEKTGATVQIRTPPGTKVNNIEMSMGQKFLHLVADPNISTLLLALAGIALYTEVSSGFTLIIPGILAVFCGLLAFVSLQMLPINLGGVLLFALGVALLIAEAFVTSFGLLALAGVGAIFLGAIFLIDPMGGDIQVSMSMLMPILLSLGVIVAIVGYIFSRDKQKKPEAFDPIVGHSGSVTSLEADKRSGTVLVQGEIWRFQSDSELKEGDEVVVTLAKGLSVRVKKK